MFVKEAGIYRSLNEELEGIIADLSREESADRRQNRCGSQRDRILGILRRHRVKGDYVTRTLADAVIEMRTDKQVQVNALKHALILLFVCSACKYVGGYQLNIPRQLQAYYEYYGQSEGSVHQAAAPNIHGAEKRDRLVAALVRLRTSECVELHTQLTDWKCFIRAAQAQFNSVHSAMSEPAAPFFELLMVA